MVVLGPTASGKSALAVALARKWNGEVISADSRQVYRGLNIGSGKITKKEMRGVRHHLLDVASPRSVFTVAQYQKRARAAVKKILARGKLPIITGGTGMYIDALIHNWELPAVKPNPDLRKKLEKKSAAELFEELKQTDRERASIIDPHNKRRLIRALEIIHATGKPVSRLGKGSPYDVLKIGIRLPDKELKTRIERRLLARLHSGMLNEVKKLRAQGLNVKRLDDFGLEYRYASRYLRGMINKKELFETLKKEIWRYAKRQMTWWKRDQEIIWIEDKKTAAPLIRQFLA